MLEVTFYLGKNVDFSFLISSVNVERFCVIAIEVIRFSVCVISVAHTFLFFGGVIVALVNCSFCGKEVSDKAKNCPNCGQQLLEKAETETINVLLCEECGKELTTDVEVCPYCGCPIQIKESDIPQKVEITSVKLPITKKNTKKYVVIGVLVIALIITGVVGSLINKSIRSSEFNTQLQHSTNLMLVGAAEAEDACNLIKAVWYNTIYEKRDGETDKFTKNKYGYFNDDFNDSLANLFSDADFQSKLTEIKNNQELVLNAMKPLQNPPEEYQDAYIAVKELYDAYIELTEMALNPSGSLTTYSTNFNNADSEFINCYKAMDLYVE